MFSGSSNTMAHLPNLSSVSESWKSKMAPNKPQVHISQLVDNEIPNDYIHVFGVVDLNPAIADIRRRKQLNSQSNSFNFNIYLQQIDTRFQRLYQVFRVAPLDRLIADTRRRRPIQETQDGDRRPPNRK